MAPQRREIPEKIMNVAAPWLRRRGRPRPQPWGRARGWRPKCKGGALLSPAACRARAPRTCGHTPRGTPPRRSAAAGERESGRPRGSPEESPRGSRRGGTPKHPKVEGGGAPRPQQLFDFAIYIFFLRFHLETPDTAHRQCCVFRSVAI